MAYYQAYCLRINKTKTNRQKWKKGKKFKFSKLEKFCGWFFIFFLKGLENKILKWAFIFNFKCFWFLLSLFKMNPQCKFWWTNKLEENEALKMDQVLLTHGNEINLPPHSNNNHKISFDHWCWWRNMLYIFIVFSYHHHQWFNICWRTFIFLPLV